MASWNAIQREYETTALSFRALATKHHIPTTTLYNRSRKWKRSADVEEQEPLSIVPAEPERTHDASGGATLGISALVAYLNKNARNMNLTDHIRASTALSQYSRILASQVAEEDTTENFDLITIDTRELSASQLAELKVFALKMKGQTG